MIYVFGMTMLLSCTVSGSATPRSPSSCLGDDDEPYWPEPVHLPFEKLLNLDFYAVKHDYFQVARRPQWDDDKLEADFKMHTETQSRFEVLCSHSNIASEEVTDAELASGIHDRSEWERLTQNGEENSGIYVKDRQIIKCIKEGETDQKSDEDPPLRYVPVHRRPTTRAKDTTKARLSQHLNAWIGEPCVFPQVHNILEYSAQAYSNGKDKWEYLHYITMERLDCDATTYLMEKIPAMVAQQLPGAAEEQKREVLRVFNAVSNRNGSKTEREVIRTMHEYFKPEDAHFRDVVAENRELNEDELAKHAEALGALYTTFMQRLDEKWGKAVRDLNQRIIGLEVRLSKHGYKFTDDKYDNIGVNHDKKCDITGVKLLDPESGLKQVYRGKALSDRRRIVHKYNDPYNIVVAGYNNKTMNRRLASAHQLSLYYPPEERAESWTVLEALYDPKPTTGTVKQVSTPTDPQARQKDLPTRLQEMQSGTFFYGDKHDC